MIKEEWRVHSTLLGNINFALVPVFILFLGFISGFFNSIFDVVFSRETMISFAHISFFVFGATIGAFGISGQEFMNRRFGQASLLAYSSRSLPISEKKIFLMMVVKDVIYYLLIWILPLILGYFIFSALFSSTQVLIILISIISISLSFLMGLSFVFFMSTIYANSLKVFLIFSALLAASIIMVNNLIEENLYFFIVPFNTIISGDFISIFYIMSYILFFFIISVAFAKFDFKQKISTYPNQYSRLFDFFKFSRYSIFLSKDFLDLRRSRGGLGKIFFSYTVPLVAIYFFVDFFRNTVVEISFSAMLSILLGIFSASIYTWITEHDLFTQYMFLPVEKSFLIKSKLFGFMAINIVSYLVIFFTTIIRNELSDLLISIFIFSVVSFYSISLTIYLTGLLPSIRFMNAKVLIAYFTLIIPTMLLFILTYQFFFIYVFVLSFVVLFISTILMKKSFSKWDNTNDGSF